MSAPTLSAPRPIRAGLEKDPQTGDQDLRTETETLTIPHARGWTSLRLLVLVICCLLNALDGMDIVIFSYIAPVLIENWHITPGTMGIIFSASLWGMMIGCLFIAPLADRFGRRRLMLIMLAIIGCSMIASGLSRSVPELLATRFAIGIGIGAILASMAALVSEYAPPNQAGLAVSIENAGYPLGAVATGLLAAKLLPIYGWQHLLLGAGCSRCWPSC
jgi:MFS family permease